MDSERYNLVFRAKLAKQAKRYDDILEWMKKVAELDVDLTLEERNLFLQGFKNKIDARRSSLDNLSSSSVTNPQLSKEYMHRIQSELSIICNDAIAIIDDHLIPSSSNSESIVLYNRKKGDYYRYLAEIKTDCEKEEAIELSLKSYQTATVLAEAELCSTNIIRLSLALNFSVLYYEVLGFKEKAYSHGRDALDKAKLEIDSLSRETYKELKPVLEALRKNLIMWASAPPLKPPQDYYYKNDGSSM